MPANLVKFVHCTPEAEHLITDMARVSAPQNQGNYDTAPRLIKYLIKHKHWSPFEMATMCVEINTTRDITAQIIRHRSFSFQEFSQRYADVRELGDISIPELRRQDEKNRQNSVADLNPELVKAFEQRIKMHFAEAMELYGDMLEVGIAKESARKVLPMNSPSRIYMTGTLRSWMHYIDLRCSNGTQKEHQDIALACKSIFEQRFPSIAQALADIESEKSYVVKETKVFEVPEGYLLMPYPQAKEKTPESVKPTRRQMIKSWFMKTVFDL